ncbi:MAG: tetratricopeptide repeat protein [Candidatus Eisenbacteria bacterium]|uniref:Tetratricopeptide repeat protein n=1 Tax=Eiseniibacteriota bacterium TaxID=2212470 RepID=A0A9D6L7M4_UNCEI|nr:tetratricopeptide repeat protein [Candidatus Eisenbacteria bacterium]MBI3540236.1 tetratricopeptide repeat protein [Candidatus Eisenbacteria bacterium]
MTAHRAIAATAMIALVATLGCGNRHAATTTPAGNDPQARSQALIDSGNQAFSAGNYGLAARRYAAAAVIKQDDPAAYYGLGMALSKLGRDEDARAAYAKARDLARPH